MCVYVCVRVRVRISRERGPKLETVFRDVIDDVTLNISSSGLLYLNMHIAT